MLAGIKGSPELIKCLHATIFMFIKEYLWIHMVIRKKTEPYPFRTPQNYWRLFKVFGNLSWQKLNN